MTVERAGGRRRTSLCRGFQNKQRPERKSRVRMKEFFSRLPEAVGAGSCSSWTKLYSDICLHSSIAATARKSSCPHDFHAWGWFPLTRASFLQANSSLPMRQLLCMRQLVCGDFRLEAGAFGSLSAGFRRIYVPVHPRYIFARMSHVLLVVHTYVSLLAPSSRLVYKNTFQSSLLDKWVIDDFWAWHNTWNSTSAQSPAHQAHLKDPKIALHDYLECPFSSRISRSVLRRSFAELILVQVTLVLVSGCPPKRSFRCSSSMRKHIYVFHFSGQATFATRVCFKTPSPPLSLFLTCAWP